MDDLDLSDLADGLKDWPDGPNPGRGPVRRVVDGATALAGGLLGPLFALAALFSGFGPGEPSDRFVNGVLPPIVMGASLTAFLLLVHAILASVANGVDRLVVQRRRKAVRGRRGAAPPSGGAPSLRPQGHFDEHP
ncbi:hypothetical protein JOD31_003623 [Methylopila capsulata]|uniref:Uncharacterized protein n=1 Tax=Methylopila capsulata TaxID=61654 RepID=A0A9W6IY35_9HYPH|nr:hypothetical protein [Methylopila capsulata]MBM7853362.1 hypothetical protein [Methylopila capsulata]GLK57425.1 hypothetical protein GCM10008170_34450 [Methylopila capsulata]